MHIHIIRKTKTAFRVEAKTIKKIESACSLLPKIQKNTEVNVVIATPKQSRELNAKYRKKQYVPDVLTFQYEDAGNVLGEMIVVPSVVKQQAKERGHSAKDEFTILVIHGIVHMLGYEHENVSRAQKASMKRVETKLLSQLGLTFTDRSY